MKKINVEKLINPLSELIKHCLINVEKETCDCLIKAEEKETSQISKWAIGEINKNNKIAREKGYLACQDCGQAILFVSIGQNIKFKGGNLTEALNNGVSLGYADARKSMADPLTRINTGTNTPAIIHYDITEGDKLIISYLSKGAGSENMSAIHMLTPSKGENGIIDCVLDTVINAGANPCPPIIIGVGIGGTMEKCALLSKKALLRPTGQKSPDESIAQLELKILEAVNKTGIGAQGFGGDTTALAVAVETFPTHIGMLPVAVNIQCHSVRHGKIEF